MADWNEFPRRRTACEQFRVLVALFLPFFEKMTVKTIDLCPTLPAKMGVL